MVTYYQDEVGNVWLSKLAKFVMENSRLLKELVKFDEEFPLLDMTEEDRKILILDWFIYDYKLKGFDKTPLEYFIESNKGMPEEERKIYAGFKQNIYSLFEVKAIKISKEMILKDLATEKEYWVWERTATVDLRKGHCVFTRVLPYQDHYILAGVGNVFPIEATYLARLHYKRLREKKVDTNIDPRQIAEIFLSLQKERPQELNLADLEEKLKEKLEEVGLTEATFLEIKEKMNKDIGPEKIIQEICEKAVFPEDEDFDTLSELLYTFWNKSPHPSMGGLSPEEKRQQYHYGPQERGLISTLLTHLQDVIKPDAHANQEDLNRAIATEQERWLNAKNPDLDGKSPKEIILEERQNLGNPLKEITIRTTAQAVRKVTKKEKEAKELFAAAITLTKECHYKEAVEKYKAYLAIFPENYAAWGNLGMLYGLLLNKKEALKCLHKALSINPNYKIAKENLALIEKANKEFLKMSARKGMIKWRT